MKNQRKNKGAQRARSLFEGLENRLLFAFGDADTDFGAAGRTTVGFGSVSRTPTVTQLLNATSSRVIAAGTTGLTRLTATGELDSSFGTNGKITLSTAATFVSAAIDPSTNNLYVLVSASSGTGVFRYSANGKLDTSYGNGGAISVTSSKSFTPQALTVDSTGRPIVAGVFKTDESRGRIVRVYRLEVNGQADTDFGKSGSFEFNLGSGGFLTPIVYDAVSGIKAIAGDKILIVGGSLDYAPQTFDENGFSPQTYGKAVLASAHLTAAGALDNTYGSSGVARAEYAAETDLTNYVNNFGFNQVLPSMGAFAVRSDGSALAAGLARAAVVAEFEPDGDVKYVATAASSSQLDRPVGIAALSDGRSILVTDPTQVTGRGFSFAAIAADGEFGNVLYTDDNDDSTNDIDEFGGGGAANTAADGRLLIGGYSGFGSNAFQVQKFLVGTTSDPRPDEFADARANDIVKDPKGGLHVAYFNAATTHLVYAHRFPNGVWEAPVEIDTGKHAGQYVSIDVNSKGNPGIAYFDGNAGDLKVAQFDGTNWKTETVDSKGSVGLYPSFQFTDADEPVVTYYNKTKGKLTFALKKGNIKWGFENVDDSGNNVGRSSFLIPSPKSNRYTVAYHDNTTGSVMWAAHQKGGIWQVKEAAKTKGGADFISMAYGANFEPAITYYDAFAADLKLSYFDTPQQKFIIKTLATSGAQGLYTSTYFGDYFGNPFAFAYHRSQDKVTVFSNSFTSTPQATDIVTGGGKFLSVDWDGRTTDLAYLDTASGSIHVRPGPTLTNLVNFS